mmetsp:Transcript_49364/g.130912  ORF Transcript_49364/g.130912 Transcript_49364/m.130912 type:complete len:121 (-) Transcript_49364:478-840(-)
MTCAARVHAGPRNYAKHTGSVRMIELWKSRCDSYRRLQVNILELFAHRHPVDSRLQTSGTQWTLLRSLVQQPKGKHAVFGVSCGAACKPFVETSTRITRACAVRQRNPCFEKFAASDCFC